MQLFNVYLKLIKKETLFLLLGLAVFLALAGILVWGSEKKEETAPGQDAVKLAWYSEDGETELLEGFLTYLGKSCVLVRLPGKEAKSREEFDEKARRAMLRGQITASLTAPSGFTADFLSGGEPALVQKQMPGRTEGTRLDFTINRFFQTAALYRDYGEKMPSDALKETSEVSFYQGFDILRRQARYANAMGYGLLVILMTGVGGSLLAFQGTAVKCRGGVAPIPPGRIYAKLLAADGIFALCVWAVFLGLMFFFIPVGRLDGRLLLLIQNSLAFLICALSLGILIGILLKSRKAGPAAHILSLFLAAMGGVFVSLETAGNGIAQVARFLPVYWFVSANKKIGELSNFSMSGVSEIYQCMLVEILFALSLFSLALVAGKRRSRELR